MMFWPCDVDVVDLMICNTGAAKLIKIPVISRQLVNMMDVNYTAM